MALSNLALFGGAFFTPILVGKITHTIGWQWSFYFIAIFCGAMLPFVFFFVPETAFRRDDSYNTDFRGAESGQHTAGSKTNAGHGPGQSSISSIPTSMEKLSASTEKLPAPIELPDTIEKHPAPLEKPPASIELPDSIEKLQASIEKQPGTDTEGRSTTTSPPKVTFARSLLPFNGRKTDENLFKLILRPLPLFLHPAVLWACLIQGTLIGWTVMIGVVLAAIFLGPPLWFTEVQTGYMYTGPFVGAVLGFVLAGILADWSMNVMVKKNKGVYEPEFRIVLVIAQMVVGCAGLYGFGITAHDVKRYGWFWPDFFFALEVMGMVLGAVASALYIVDAHRKSSLTAAQAYKTSPKLHSLTTTCLTIGEIAVEAFTCLLIFKNVFSFGLTYGAYDWIVAAGIAKVFYIIASVQVGVCLLSIPMCKYYLSAHKITVSLSRLLLLFLSALVCANQTLNMQIYSERRIGRSLLDETF